MEEFLYNILWIDDEHESLAGTKGRAKRNGINLISYKSLNGGMSELERNYPFYDGVLLDAKIFKNEDDEKGTEDTFNVHRAKEILLGLKKKFEIFILTGQSEAYEDKTFTKAFTKVYKKGSDAEMDRLFSDIKEAAKNQQDTQIRHSFKRVFEVCTERYIGEYAGKDLLTILKACEETDINNQFNTIRKIVEDLLITFNKYNLLPSEFVNPHVALNQSSIFLAGKDQKEKTDPIYKQYKHLEETHLPPQIAYYLKCILNTTQDGSHRSSIDCFVKTVNTPYLFNSVLYQLMDILIWFKIYVDSKPKAYNWQKIENPEPEQLKIGIELPRGEVINIDPVKGFAFFKSDKGGDNTFIPPHIVTQFNLQNNMKVRVEVEEYFDNRSGEKKTRVNNLEIIL